MKIGLSLVIPVYNEEKNISLLFKRLNALAKKFPAKTEVILVDDGSKDQTARRIKKTPLRFQKHLVQFSRNFGHQAALLAGMEAAQGDIIVTLDGDLQHPPEFILHMLSQHKKGIDIVLTQRTDAVDTSFFKKTTTALFYKIANAFSDTTISENSSDFRSMNRKALRALLSLPERRKFLRGMVQWIGFTTVTLSYQAESRKFGVSKYSFFKMFRLALHGVSSFSALPLYFAGLFSGFLFLCALVYGGYVVYVRFVLKTAETGWASVILLILIIGSCTSLFLGLIGVYLAAIYDEVKRRPSYLIKNKT